MPISIFKSSCYGNINLFRCYLYTKIISIVFDDNIKLYYENAEKDLRTKKVPKPIIGIRLPSNNCTVSALSLLQYPNTVQRQKRKKSNIVKCNNKKSLRII